MEDVDYIIDYSPWVSVEDHSLKIRGIEFTIPVLMSDSKQALEHLFSAITCKTSSRCSTHIHLDISGWTFEEVQNLIYLYLLFEPVLFNFSGKRNNSNYCVPVQDLEINDLRYFMGNTKKLKEILTKYTAIHFLPLHNNVFLNTLEFRHMKGTTDVDYIHTWIRIITELAYAALYYSKTIKIPFLELIKDMRCTSQYINLTQQVFKTTHPDLFYPEISKDLERSITNVKCMGI